MPESAMNPFARLVNNATMAVDAYLDRVLPGRPPEAQAQDRGSPETLHCLLSDLLHYCDHHDLDFDQVLDWARTSYADDLALEQTFTYGDEVQPRTGATWRGIVTGLHTTHQYDDVLHTIRIPGERETRVVPVEDLRPATSFGPIDTPNGPVSTAQDAEGRLEEVSLLIRRAEHDGRVPAPDLYAEQHELTEALANWSGGSSTGILQFLGPRIATALEEQRRRTPPTDLAGTGFPNDIAGSLADAPSPQERPSPEPPNSNARRRNR